VYSLSLKFVIVVCLSFLRYCLISVGKMTDITDDNETDKIIKKALTKCLNEIDKDRDGFIKQKELEQLLTAHYADPDCQAMKDGIDPKDIDIKRMAEVREQCDTL
jgi:hypothetical protein